MAKLVKIDRNGSKHYEGLVECDRCQGRGLYAVGVCNGQLVITTVDNGICHKCGGSGKVMSKWIERTPEYQAKLDARREAKFAKIRAEQEAQIAEAERIRKEAEAKAEQERLAEEARIKAQKAISKYVGEIGERISFDGIFDHTAWYKMHINHWEVQTMFVHTFKDSDGNKFVWKTSSNSLPDFNYGEPVNVRGTVKEHSEYKDEKQTVLTRCKVQRA